MSKSEALEEIARHREGAWRYMLKYHGQTPFFSWVVFRRGRMFAASLTFTNAEWHELNLAMWRLIAEQAPLWDDMDKQPSMFDGRGDK